jgi:hypothetical protein
MAGRESVRLLYTPCFLSHTPDAAQSGSVPLSQEYDRPRRYPTKVTPDHPTMSAAFVEFLANVLIGNNIDRYDFKILDLSNERSGSSNQVSPNLPTFTNSRA